MNKTNANIIEIEGLQTQYGQHVVHCDLDLNIKKGESLSLIGGSGSGKTTLLRQILGLEQPSKGRIQVFGESRYNDGFNLHKNIRKRTGVLFQQGALFSALTVYDNIALPLRELHLLDEHMIHDLVMTKLDMVAIGPEHAFKLPANLSGGMIKRVSLARALVLDPELLLLDEPTAGLDPSLSKSFVALILDMRKELDLTMVMVTHDKDILADLSDRVAVLADKKVVATGTLEQIRNHTHPFINHFFNNVGEKH